MPTIVRELPYFNEPTSVRIRGRSVPVKRSQIIVWISISAKGAQVLSTNAPRLPAILDTGCNHNLLINQQHLMQWAGLHADYLPKLARVRVAGVHVSQLAANIWLHPNVPHRRDDLAIGPPYKLEVSPGIAVYPVPEDRIPYPRLPLLGLRAFRRAGLQIRIDCDRLRVNIGTRRRFWVFG